MVWEILHQKVEDDIFALVFICKASCQVPQVPGPSNTCLTGQDGTLSTVNEEQVRAGKFCEPATHAEVGETMWDVSWELASVFVRMVSKRQWIWWQECSQ